MTQSRTCVVSLVFQRRRYQMLWCLPACRPAGQPACQPFTHAPFVLALRLAGLLSGLLACVIACCFACLRACLYACLLEWSKHSQLQTPKPTSRSLAPVGLHRAHPDAPNVHQAGELARENGNDDHSQAKLLEFQGPPQSVEFMMRSSGCP